MDSHCILILVMQSTTQRPKPYDLIEFDDDENVICEIKKHYFGLFLVYFTGLALALTILVVSTVISLWLEDKSTSTLNTSNGSWVVMLVGIIASVIIIGLTFIYAYIFKSNVVVLTNEKVAQIIYKSLFDRKVSQLNISDVQDVTTSQKGVFARTLNYGTIVIETAGEQQNYTFTFAPRPHDCAKEIIAAHESNVKRFGN